MDKRNRPALAYLLVGVAAAGRAFLAMPDGTALQEVSLTVLALVGYLLLGRQGLPAVVCGGVQLVLELVLCGTLQGPAWLDPLLRDAALWLLWVTVVLMLRTAGQTKRTTPTAAAVVLAVYSVAHFIPSAATVASMAFIVFSILLLWYAVLLLRAYNDARVKK